MKYLKALDCMFDLVIDWSRESSGIIELTLCGSRFRTQPLACFLGVCKQLKYLNLGLSLWADIDDELSYPFLRWNEFHSVILPHMRTLETFAIVGTVFPQGLLDEDETLLEMNGYIRFEPSGRACTPLRKTSPTLMRETGAGWRRS